MLFIFPLGIML